MITKIVKIEEGIYVSKNIPEVVRKENDGMSIIEEVTSFGDTPRYGRKSYGGCWMNLRDCDIIVTQFGIFQGNNDGDRFGLAIILGISLGQRQSSAINKQFIPIAEESLKNVMNDISILVTMHGYFDGNPGPTAAQERVKFFPFAKKVEFKENVITSEKIWNFPNGSLCHHLKFEGNSFVAGTWIELAWIAFACEITKKTFNSENKHLNPILSSETEEEWIFTQSVHGYDSNGKNEIRIKKLGFTFKETVIEEPSNVSI